MIKLKIQQIKYWIAVEIVMKVLNSVRKSKTNLKKLRNYNGKLFLCPPQK